MKSIIKKIKDFFTKLLGNIRYDHVLHFLFGVIIASFVAIVFPSSAPWAVFVSFGVGLLKEFIDGWIGDGFNGYDAIATLLGGALIEVFILI